MPTTISSTTSLATMLPEYARRIGSYVGSFTTTTAIAANTSVVCTTLADRGFDVDDLLNDFYIKITSQNNDGAIRRISDYTGSSGTITVSGSSLSSDSSTQATFEIYRYDPQRLTDTLQDAAQEIFPRVFVPVYNNTSTAKEFQYNFTRPTSIPRGYVRQVWIEKRLDAKTSTDNILSDQNCDMEESSSSITDWTASNITAAVEADTTDPDNAMVWGESQSAKLTVSASSVGQFYLSVTNPTNYEGEELNFAIWVYSKTASRVSAFLQTDSDTVVTGDSHTGNGWERITVTTVANNVSSSIKAGIQISSGDAFTCYADEAIATSGREEMPRAGRIAVRNWREEDTQIRITEAIPEDHNLMIVGMGMLDFGNLSSSAQEINENNRRLLYYTAASILFQGEIDTVDSTEQQQALNRYNHFRRLVEQMTSAMIPMAMIRNTAS